MSIVHVTLVGAAGNLGAYILDALVGQGTFKVTILQRASSKSQPAHQDKIRVLTISEDLLHDELTSRLRGQDALIVCYRAQNAEAQIKFGKAAAAAGVKRLIPADFGSCDSDGKRERELVPLFERKRQVRKSLQELAAQNEGFSWTSLVTGHFFDWGLRENFLHFNLQTRKADIIDDGNMKGSQATLPQVAKAVVSILKKLEETRNRLLFIQSFCVSQNDVLTSLEKAMGVKWDIVRYDSEEFIKEKKALVDNGDATANEDLVFVLGAINGNWEERPNFAMKLLGMENEDLDAVVQKVVDEMASS